MDRLTKRHGKYAVQIGGETRRNDVGWLRLADYEDLEEQGRLITLPCAVGQEVYAVIRAMDITETGRFVPSPIIRTITPVSLQDCWRISQDVGMSIFLTEEEAEAKLAELKGVKE